MEQVLPFRLLGETQLGQMSQRIQALIDEWSNDWFAKSPQTLERVTLSTASTDGVAGRWLVTGEAPDEWVAWRSPAEYFREFAELIFGVSVGAVPKPGQLVEATLGACRRDLAHRMLAVVSQKPRPSLTTTLDDYRIGYGSGSVFFQLPKPLPPVWIACGGGAVFSEDDKPTASISGARALTARHEAIGRGRFPVEVVLGMAELSLGELAHLAKGDVIVLDASTSAPIPIRTSAGIPIAAGDLGRYEERRAIQIHSK